MRFLTRKAAAAVLAVTATLTGVAATTAAPAGASAASYNLFYTRLPNGQNVAQRWNPCQTITFKVNVGAVPAAYRSYAVATTQQALAKISAINGLRFTYKGLTSEVPQQQSDPAKQSAEIIIAWTTPAKTNFPLYGSTAGFGGHMNLWWESTDSRGRLVEQAATTRGYVVLDTPQMFAQMRRGFGPGVTQGNVVLHELGHVIGLDHVTLQSQIMYPSISSASPNGYGYGDRAGLARLGRAAGCISVPSWVSTDLS